jgi:hypothetical protein
MKRSKDMNTKQIATEYRITHWASIMRERTERGLNIRAFCEEKGIHENVYYYWQKKLREAACEQLSVMDNKSSRLSLQAGSFTEVKVARTCGRISNMEKPERGEIRIEIAGVMLSADSVYPTSNIVELIKGLNRI